MRRRNVLLGLGAAAAGGAAVFGSGAFTQLEAERDFSIEVAGDTDAFLRLDDPAADTAYSPFDDAANHIDWLETEAIEHDADGALSVTLDDELAEGSGVNVDSYATLGLLDTVSDNESNIDQAAFVIYNAHENTLDIDAAADGNDEILEIRYTTADPPENDGDLLVDTLTLAPGDVAGVVLWLDTGEDDTDSISTVTITATDADV